MDEMLRLIEPLIPALRRYARSLMLQDRAAADDLVQDCLERAITRWHQRRADGDARSWIFTILHNLAINRMRQVARRGRHIPIEDAEAAVPGDLPLQEDGLLRRDLLRALGDLPEDQRSVLLLVAVEGLSYIEAASVLGVPVGTLTSRLARARDRLARAMEGDVNRAAIPGSHLRRVK
jgi:RNA polymerase sigma-70 factor (ECF subfamily)